MCRYNIYYRNGKQQHRKLSTTNATYFCLARVSKKETSKNSACVGDVGGGDGR